MAQFDAVDLRRLHSDLRLEDGLVCLIEPTDQHAHDLFRLRQNEIHRTVEHEHELRVERDAHRQRCAHGRVRVSEVVSDPSTF